RQYLPGHAPPPIQWRSSAKAATLTVRKLEEDTTLDTRLLLEGTGVAHTARFEAGLSEAASLAVHLLRAGAGVELVGPGVRVPPGRGRDHEVRLLTALALYDPEERRGSEWDDGPLPETGGVPPAAVREIRVQLA